MKLKISGAPPRLAHIVLLLCILVAAQAVTLLGKLNSGFSDNLMRLVEVRDWLGGQAWADLMQHRLLPPGGVSMHWSRYVDAGIAALLVPLSWIFPMATAEMLTQVLWPSLLLVGLCVVVAWGGNRLLGPAAAIGGGLMAVFWAKIGPGKFGPGNLDHHNVQVLFSTIALALAIVPPRDLRRGAALMGALAGAATAFALAVGLEMLPMLFLLWGLAALRLAFGTPGSAPWLTGFSLSLGLSAPLLMIGQTAPAEWLLPWCDELAPPLLAVIAAGIAASLAGVAAARRISSPLALFAIMAAIAGIGLWLSAPLTAACLNGPYGAMPEEARRIIEERIAEAQPAWRSFQILPFGVNALMTPAIAVTLLAAALGWSSRRTLTAVQRQALTILLAISVTGLVISMVQIRALAVSAPAITFLAGFVLWHTAALFSGGRTRTAALSALLAVLFIAVPQVPLAFGMLATGWLPDKGSTEPNDPDAWQPLSGSCRTQGVRDQLAALSSQLPTGSIILSELNFGSMILAYTPFGATSAGYHRSGDAFVAGVIPFQRAEGMIRMLRKTGADYVMVCRAGGGGGRFGAELLAGDLPAWLSAPQGNAQEVLLLKVDKPALATLPATPADEAAAQVTQ